MSNSFYISENNPLNNTLIYSVDTIASLRSRHVSIVNEKVFVVGRNSTDDGFWGIYLADLSDKSSIDDGKEIIVSSDGTRWKRVAFYLEIDGLGADGIIPGSQGGTGVNNSGKTITLGGNLTTSGGNITFSTTGATNLALPSSGTLVTNNNSTFTGTANFNNLAATGVITGNVAGNVSGTSNNVTGIVLPANGGTGVNNSGKTITLGGNLTTSGAFSLTLNTTANTNITLPASGTLAATNNATFTGTTNLNNAEFAGEVGFNDTTVFRDDITIDGDVTVDGSGSLTFNKNIDFQGEVAGLSIPIEPLPPTMGESVTDNFFASVDGYDHPDVTPNYKSAAISVKNARQTIINTAYATFTLPPGESEVTCGRDIGFVVDAIAADLGNSNDDPSFRSNLYSIQAGRAYYDLDGTRRIGSNEVAPSKTAFNSVASQVISSIGTSFASYVNSLRDIINGYLDNGLNWAAAPEVRYGVQRGRFIDGSNLIKANRNYIVNQVLADLQAAPYNYTLPTGTKCARDLNFVIDAAIADIRNLSNVNAIKTGLNYYDSGKLVISTDGTPSELTKTITAFTLTRNYCMQAVQNKLPNTSNITEVEGELNIRTISSGGSQYEGSECASVANAAYTLFNIIIGYLENGVNWVNAPKRNNGLIDKQLPGRSWRTAFASIKRALAEVAKFPGKECTVRVSSGKFYEDNPLIIPQPKTAVIGDNLRTTTICPLNHGQDLFKLDSGTYLNYMVFEDNYLGGYGVLQTPSGSKEISATATVFTLFPGHTIKDVPGRFKDAANLVRANRLYIDGQVSNYNALPIIDAVIADLRSGSNINAIAAGSTIVNNPTKVTDARNLILAAIRNELPNSEANQTSGTNFSALLPDGSQRVDDLCANVQLTVTTLVSVISSIASGEDAPPRNTGTLLLVNQEWMQINSINDNVVNVTRGIGTTATRHISGSKCTQNAKAFRYAAAFKDGTNIFLSPYIQNCSNISVLGRTVLKNDGSGELDDTQTLAGGILVDGGVLANTSPIASMVMDAFTQIVSGSVGFHHKNDGYSQLVSVFTVFEYIGILCESGAYTSVTNSATNFGNTALKAVGFSTSAFPFYKGTVSSAINKTLTFNDNPSDIFTSEFTAQGNQTKVTLTVEAEKISQFVVGQTITVSGHSVVDANGTGFIITEVIGSDRSVSYLVNSPLPSGGITPGGQTGTVKVSLGRLVTEIGIQGFTSIPIPNYVVKVSGTPARTDGIEYIVEESTSFNQSGICTITLQIPWLGTLPTPGTAIELRRPSTVNSSSHTFEFIGSGINYTALPENGGVTDPQSQTVEVKSGKVYCSATDQDGNFTVGPFFRVALTTGKVTFTGPVSLGVLDEIQLKNSPGVPIRQFSIDNDLDGINTQHTRIATQKAVRDFVELNLGDLFKKKTTTSGGISNAGQLVELDETGFIGRSQIPPTNPFKIITVANEAERLALTESQVNQGDYVTQTDNQTTYILKTTLDGGASDVNNWAVLPAGVTSADSITGIIDAANLGTGTANANTFLAGSKAYLPVAKSISAEGAVIIGSSSSTPDNYPVGSKVGDITIGVNTTQFVQGQTSGASSLGVARFAYEDFDVIEGTVYIKDEAVDLNEIKHIKANTVLGNDTSATGLVKELPLNEAIATVTTINVSFANNQYSFTSNNINLGSTLYLTKGQTYKFVINTPGNPFQLALPDQTAYNAGLQGTNGTAVTNDSTKFIWTVSLNAPDKLRYQSSNAPTIGGLIITGQTYLGTAGTIQVNQNLTNNTIDLATVPQIDTNGTAGINFVQSISKDSYGRVTGRVLADIRTASTTESGIVQLNSATNSTSSTEAATPSAVKTAYDLAASAIPSSQKEQANGVATLGSDGKIPGSQLPSTLVTSVGLALPDIFTVTNTPVTSSGTLTGQLAPQQRNLFFAGPVSGNDAAPTFRMLVDADFPLESINITKILNNQQIYRKLLIQSVSPSVSVTQNTTLHTEYVVEPRTSNLEITLHPVPTTGQLIKFKSLVLPGTGTVTIKGNPHSIDGVMSSAEYTLQPGVEENFIWTGSWWRVERILGADGLIPSAQIPRSISRSAIASATITLGIEHNGLIIETIATTSVILNLPNNLPAGFNCIVVQKDIGQITFTPITGAILRHPDGHTKSAKQYASCTLYVSTNSGTNAEYILSGNTVA